MSDLDDYPEAIDERTADEIAEQMSEEAQCQLADLGYFDETENA